MQRNRDDHSALKALDKKLEALEKESDKPSTASERMNDASKSGLGQALRMSTDLVAAIVVGVLIGLGLDYLLGTKPWMMVLFLVLGFAAGMLNVYRAMTGQLWSLGYKKTPQNKNRKG